MTTFNTQRGDPQIAEAEARLLDILTRLGQQRIPELEVGDFLEDLQSKPEAEPREGKLGLFEEETGVRLLLRILEQVVSRVFNKLTNVTESLEKTSLEKLRLEEENKCLEKEVKSLKASKLRVSTAAKSEVEKLKEENAKLKSLLASHSKSPEATEVSLKKRKKSPLFDKEKVASSPNMQRSGSVLFPRNVSPHKVALLHSTAAHLDDTSFVPETLEVFSSPGCKKSTTFRGNRSVPDTPEKEGPSPSANIEVFVSPVKVAGICRTRNTPPSPVITSTKKRKPIRIVESKENRTKNSKAEPVKSSKVRRSKPNNSTDERNILKVTDDLTSLNSKKVGKIDLGAQSEINRKSFQQFEDDFPKKKTSKRSENFRNIPSDTDSDFESPNLLKRQRLISRKTEEATRKENLKIEKMFEVDLDEDIEVFDSQVVEEEKLKAQPRKGKTTSIAVRSENRWGIEVGLPSVVFWVKTYSCFSTRKSCPTPTRSLFQRSSPESMVSLKILPNRQLTTSLFG